MKALNFFLFGFFVAVMLGLSLFRWETDIIGAEILGQQAFDYLFDSKSGFIIRVISVAGFLSTLIVTVYNAGRSSDHHDQNNNLLQTN